MNQTPEDYTYNTLRIEQHNVVTHRRSRDTRWRSWLKHCATRRKVPSSTPDASLRFFIDLILPSALWPWPRRKSDRYVNLTTLPLSCADCLEMLGASPSPGAAGACSGLRWHSYSIYRRTYLTSATTYEVSRNRPHFLHNQQLTSNFSKSISKFYNDSTAKTRV